MDKLTIIGRIFFAIALMGFGVENFLFGEFLPGRAPAWPELLLSRSARPSSPGKKLVLLLLWQAH